MITLLVATGDTTGAAAAAQILLPQNAVRIPLLLHVARLLRPSNSPLAVRLWRKAVGQPALTDEDIVNAADLGFQLGLDQELGSLIQQFPRIAATNSGLIKIAPLEEVIGIMRDRAQALEEANAHYNRGLLPVHLTSEALHCALGFLYHILPKANASANTPLRNAPLMCRTGARGFENALVLSGKKIVLDITSLLLARHIGILDLVEKHVSGISVSAWLPASLQKQIHESTAGQPALEGARAQVFQLFAQGVIKRLVLDWHESNPNDVRVKQMGADWVAELTQVRRDNGLYVTFFPITARIGERHVLSLTPDELKTIVPVGTFLAGLREAGVLSASEITACNQPLGIEAQFTGEKVAIGRGMIVMLETVIAESFAKAGVLAKVADFCQLRFNSLSAQQLESQREAWISRDEQATWLKALFEHVGDQIRTGAYTTFSNPPSEEVEANFQQQPDLGCLHDLISSQGDSSTILWCDDRLLTSYARNGSTPVVSVLEILAALRNEGVLSKEEYFSKLHELRKSNVRYLPFTAEEILFELSAAPIVSDHVQETAELGTLRMSLASALADTPRLQLPGQDVSPHTPIGDLPWIVDASRAAFEALQFLWKGENIAEVLARSEWLIDSLIFDLGALRDLHRPTSEAASAQDFFLLNVMEWILVAFRQESQFLKDDSADSRRKLYFRWLYGRVIVPALTANPEIETALGEALSKVLTQTVTTGVEAGREEPWI